TRKPPFDKAKVRQAVSRAIDRRALIAAVYQGGATLGASMLPRPYGVWGMLEADLRGLAGYGNPGEEKAHARRLLGETGFGPGSPLKIEMVTRNLPAFADLSAFVISELKRVGIDASLRQVTHPSGIPCRHAGSFSSARIATGSSQTTLMRTFTSTMPAARRGTIQAIATRASPSSSTGSLRSWMPGSGSPWSTRSS